MALSPQVLALVSKAKNKYSGNSGKALRPKEGRNTYRLIAPPPNAESWVGPTGQWWADLGVHWIKADSNGKPLVVLGDCDTVYQQPSVINAAIDRAIAEAIDEDSKKLYEDWRAKRSVLLNVIDRSTPGDEPEVLELTPTTFGKVLDLYTMYAEAGQDITDPASGVDIVITRTGKGLNTNYDVAVAPVTPTTPHKPVPKASIEKAVDLKDYIARNYFRGEEQKALNCIAQIAGVALPALSAPSQAASITSTPTAALASPAVAVADAEVVNTPAADPVVVDQNAELAARRAALLKKQQEELAALEAATATPAAAPAAAVAAPATAVLTEDETDSILSQLDDLV